MSLRLQRPFVASLCGLALAAVLAGGPAFAAPAGPPAGLAPLPPELARPLPDLERAAAEYRGIPFRHPVPAGVLTGAALRREVDRQMAEEMAPGTLAALGAGLKAFGLIPEAMDLATYYPTLLSSQIAAFYDPHRKYLAVVDLGKKQDEAVARELGAAFAERARQAVLVHELTHALQDQAFDMTRYESNDPLSDASAARLALVEGDATATMMDFLVGTRIEALPGAAGLMGSMLKDEGAGVERPGFPGSEEIAAAPAWFRDSLLFSYVRGFGFCVAVRQRGGQKLLDYAFAKDPPRSSEQVLHPEKWFGRRDDPRAIALPDLAPLLPGARRVVEGELGEEGIRVLLAAPLGGADAAAAPAAGWGGDRFAVYQQGDRRLLAWVTEWDTDADAAEFLAAAGRLGAGWTARRTAPTRVVVLRGTWAGNEPEAAIARLAAAPAGKPANRPIDLAALGVPPQAPAKPEPQDGPAADPDGARSLPHLDGRRYTNPAHGFAVELPEAGGPWQLGTGAAAEVPLVAKSADGAVVLEVRDRGEPQAPIRPLGEALAREVERQGGRVLRSGLATSAGPYDLEAEQGTGAARVRRRTRLYVEGGHRFDVTATAPAASWPARAAEVAALLDGFALDERPPDAPFDAHLSADRRTFRDPGLGLSIRLPRGEPGWQWAAERHGAPVALESADGAVRLYAADMALDVPLEAMGPMMARTLAAKGFRPRGSRLVRRAGVEYWELEIETGDGGRGGPRVHERRRIYRGTRGAIVVTAVARSDRYGRHEAAIVEALDSVEVEAGGRPIRRPAAPSAGS